jgi:hypothetical protein
MSPASAMTDAERDGAAKLLDKLEVSIGELTPRHGPNAPLIASIIEDVNGLRSLLGLVRPH